MVLAYHLIMSAYGFWLPNDPRGSWSKWIRKWELVRFGQPHRPDTTRSVAGVLHDQELRQLAKESLKYPPLIFDGKQARAVARGFATAGQKAGYFVHACAIMRDHVHLVIARPGNGRLIEKIAAHLKAKASMQLTQEEIHPMMEYRRHISESPPSVWVRNQWKCYLDNREDIVRAINYVEENPAKEGLKRQHWGFVGRMSG